MLFPRLQVRTQFGLNFLCCFPVILSLHSFPLNLNCARTRISSRSNNFAPPPPPPRPMNNIIFSISLAPEYTTQHTRLLFFTKRPRVTIFNAYTRASQTTLKQNDALRLSSEFMHRENVPPPNCRPKAYVSLMTRLVKQSQLHWGRECPLRNSLGFTTRVDLFSIIFLIFFLCCHTFVVLCPLV